MIAVFAVPLLLRGTWLIATGKGLSFSTATDPTVHERA
jgi:hypothetical protein